eukprot:1915689-Prymnesium_polylepis.1
MPGTMLAVSGSDFGQIGPAVSAAVNQCSPPRRFVFVLASLFEGAFGHGTDFGQIGPAVSRPLPGASFQQSITKY